MPESLSSPACRADLLGIPNRVHSCTQDRESSLKLRFANFHISTSQKLNRSDPCMIRGDRVLLTCPKVGLTWLPFASNRAVVSTPLNCVWLNTLYISHRNCR